MKNKAKKIKVLFETAVEKIDLNKKFVLAKEEKVPFLGEISIDIKLREMVDKGDIKLNHLNPKIKKTLNGAIKNISSKSF